MSFQEPLANPYLGTIVKANDRVCFVIDKLDVDDAAVRNLAAQIPLDLLSLLLTLGRRKRSTPHLGAEDIAPSGKHD